MSMLKLLSPLLLRSTRGKSLRGSWVVIATSRVWLEIGEHMLRTTISFVTTGVLKCLFVMVTLMILNSRNCSFCTSKGFKTFFSLLVMGRRNFLLKDSFIKDFCEPESKRIIIFLFKFWVSLLVMHVSIFPCCRGRSLSDLSRTVWIYNT